MEHDRPGYGDATTIGVPPTFRENGIKKQAQTLSGLSSGTTYHFLMHACNPNGCGHWSYPAKQVTTSAEPTAAPVPTTAPPSTPSVSAPHRPHTIQFRDTTSTSVRVTWRAASNTGGVPLTGFDLRYWPYDATNPNSETGARTHPADGGSDRSETVEGLDANTEYELKMRACNRPNNSNCSRWSADHRFTTTAGTGTPPPGAFQFSATVAAQVYRAGQLVSVQLPAATGGAGHVTYRLSPAMGNGLSFDGPTRTIAGTPQQAAEQTTYTYTATDTNNSRVQLSVPLTVFNVHLLTWHRDDDTYRRIGDGVFVDTVYSRWSVLQYAGVEPREPITRTAGFRFQVRLPAHVGFQVGTTCTWPAAAPTSTDMLQTPWIAPGQAFAFARCSLGSGRAATVELWVREPGGAEFLLETRRLVGQQAWHIADHVADVYVRGTNNDGVIQLVESARDEGDGLFPGLRPPKLGVTVTPNPLLGSWEQYSEAAGVWHAVDGVRFARATVSTMADVVIEGYWDRDPPDGNDGVCNQSIACMYLSGPYPDLELGRRLMIEDPPHWGSDAKALTWTNVFTLESIEPQQYQYLPAVLVHEFGHAIGLGHSNHRFDIMNGWVRQIGCTGSNCGLSDNDREGARALYTSPHHAPH